MNCNAALPEVYYECNDCGHKEDGEFVATDWEGCLKNCQAGCQGSVECEVECVDVGFRSCVLSRTERVEDQLCINRCMPDEDAPDFEQMRECWAGCFPRAEDIYLTECPDPLAAEDLTECKQEPLVDVQT
jgi:hypothetical protein